RPPALAAWRSTVAWARLVVQAGGIWRRGRHPACGAVNGIAKAWLLAKVPAGRAMRGGVRRGPIARVVPGAHAASDRPIVVWSQRLSILRFVRAVACAAEASGWPATTAHDWRGASPLGDARAGGR